MFRIEVKEKLMKTRIDGHLHSDKKNMFFGTQQEMTLVSPSAMKVT